MNWRIVAVIASLVPFLLLFAFTPVSPNDVFSVGIIPFVMSVGAVMVRVLLQAYRFRYFIKHFISPQLSSTGKIMVARLAGEFVTQTTPSYVGGEIVRIAWLTKNGVPAGQAAWVATTEIISDVFVGSTLAFIAGGLALFHGGTFIGTIVILVAIPTFTFWLLVVILSAKRNIQLPRFALKLLQRFLSTERALHLVGTTNTALTDLCKMSREHFNSRESVKVFAIGIAMTFVAFLFQGVSFLVLANAVHERVGLLESFMATSASTALSTLPITIGGSGLAELGIWAYISNLNGIPHIADILKDSQLSVIIAWRIATYHIPLVIMWISLMKITVGKESIAVRLRGTSRGATDSKNESNLKSGNEKDLYGEKKKSNLGADSNNNDNNSNSNRPGDSSFSSSPDTSSSSSSTFSTSAGPSPNSDIDCDSKSEFYSYPIDVRDVPEQDHNREEVREYGKKQNIMKFKLDHSKVKSKYRYNRIPSTISWYLDSADDPPQQISKNGGTHSSNNRNNNNGYDNGYKANKNEKSGTSKKDENNNNKGTN